MKKGYLIYLLGGADEFLALVFLQLLNCVLVDGVNHVKDLQAQRKTGKECKGN